MSDISHLRNFSIIAHIDHGKSTLADRFLEVTGTVPKRLLRDQFLDQMDLERERGITIKLQSVRMEYRGLVLNLIDTPGHVDFTDEVSRSLAAVEGAILLVDATQGIQAQTVAHFRRARALGLVFIPVVNKIDLPNAETEHVVQALAGLLDVDPQTVLRCSAKTGSGVAEILDAVIERVPPPSGSSTAPVRALIIDSLFDPFLGVVAFIRVVDGRLTKGDRIVLLGSRAASTALEVGLFHPDRKPAPQLTAGEIGYIITGLKNLVSVRVGDTIAGSLDAKSLGSFSLAQPVVFAGLFPGDDGGGFEKLRGALEKLKLNDAALTFQPEHTKALGYGFRCGFLGLLHLDIVRERLKREFSLEPTFSYPSVAYRCRVSARGGEREVVVRSPADFPGGDILRAVEEPWSIVEILTPPTALSALLQIIREARGSVVSTDNFAEDQLLIRAEIPLASILVDFYDKVKSVSSGFASLDVALGDYRPADAVKLDIVLNGEAVESLSTIIPKAEAQRRARQIVEKLEAVIPREQFEIRIQAAVAGDILASGRISALRKDVLAKLYGGDVTRKMKLLKKQKRGKKRMRAQGTVHLAPEVVTALLKPDRG